MLIFCSVRLSAENSLLFKPLTANVFEPTIGTLYQIADDRLRLDIGYSLDFIELVDHQDFELNAGADFFTYTRLRSEGRMKFPVETSDYFFGVNLSLLKKLDEIDIAGRLRISHISSHLVDGLSEEGQFSRMPFVYSREFVDLTVAAQSELVRIYAGMSFVFSTQPDDVAKMIPQAGMDITYKLSNLFDFNCGYDFKLNGFNDVYWGVNALKAGVLTKTSDFAGIFIYAFFYDGPSMHGMFYKETDSYGGIGFQLIFY